MHATDRRTELETALRAVRLAAAATTAVRRDMPGAGAREKQDRSPVTVADYAAQAVVASVLAEQLPADPIVGEEDAGALRQPDAAELRGRVVRAVGAALGRDADADRVLGWLDRGGARGDTERYWALDPIDGTKGFLRGGQYAIALALIERGEVTVAVLGCPSYTDRSGRAGILCHATRGGGAFELGLQLADAASQPLRVATPAGWSAVRFCESVESGHSDQGTAGAVAKALGITAEPVRMDSQAKYAAVARGDADVYMRLPTRKDYREKIWDHAAGLLVLQEAGGVVTDVDGRALDFGHGRTLAQNRGVLGSWGGDHDRLVAAVGQALRG